MAQTPRLKRGACPIFAHVTSGFLVAVLSACAGTGPEIFREIPPSATLTDESATDWPRLAEIPPAPPPDFHTAAAPDPALGEVARIEAAIAVETAERRRAAIAGPVE